MKSDLHDMLYQTGKKINSLVSFDEKWDVLFQSGLTQLFREPDAEGKGSRVYNVATALEKLAEATDDNGILFSLSAHLCAGSYPVIQYGSEELLKIISKERYILANAMTESSSGSDAFRMKTTATKDGDEYVLNGVKIFCTNGPKADGIVVYAMTDAEKGFFGGISAFLLLKNEHTFETGPEYKKHGLHSSPLCDVFLNDVRVNKRYLLGSEGAGGMIFLQSMNCERAVIAAMHSGTQSRIIQHTAAYIKNKSSGGKLLSSHQAVQFRIAEMELRRSISQLMALRAARAIDTGNSDELLAAAQAKILVSESLIATARDAMQLHGGYGYLSEYSPSQDLADAEASAIYSGPNDVLRQLISSRLDSLK